MTKAAAPVASTVVPAMKKITTPTPTTSIPNPIEVGKKVVDIASKPDRAPILNIPKMAKKTATPWWKKASSGASTIINGDSKKSTGTGIEITPGALQIPTEYTPAPDAKPVDPATVPANPKEIEDLLNGLFGY
jgi:hypothetical protein